MTGMEDDRGGRVIAVLEPATGSDLESIMILEQQAFGPSGWSVDGWRAELEAADRDVLVARDGTQAVIGVITVQTVGTTADLHRLVVADRSRRHGVGTDLVDAGVRAARARGAERMLLEVESDNDPAVALYQRYGFEQLGSRPDYYGPGRHALIMKRYALDGPLVVQVDWLPDGRGDHD